MTKSSSQHSHLCYWGFLIPKLDKVKLDQFLDFINKKLNEPLSEREKYLLERLGKHRFEHLANK